MHLVKDYRVISLPLGAEAGAAVHLLFVKEHRDSKASEDRGKVLFVGNIDYGFDRSLDAIDGYLRALFGIFGEISGISVSSFESTESSTDYDTRARFAHITYQTRSALRSALKADDRVFCERGLVVAQEFGTRPPISHKAILNQVKNKFKWVDVSVEELRAEVEEYMHRFEEEELAEKKDSEHRAKHADADGFVLVQNKYAFAFDFS